MQSKINNVLWFQHEKENKRASTIVIYTGFARFYKIDCIGGGIFSMVFNHNLFNEVFGYKHHQTDNLD